MVEISDLVGFKEPMTKLVECLRDATGVVYEPTRIRRRAKAEADAALILVNAEIQKNDLLRKAAERLATTEIRRQENIEAIVSEASKVSRGENPESKPENDWINNFFEEAKDISDQDLQKIWANILGGEIDSPGQFSRKTLAILKQIGKKEAAKFHKFCCLCWQSNAGDIFVPIDHRNRALAEECGLSFDDCQELETLGLIYANPLLGIAITNHTVLSYFDVSFYVKLGEILASEHLNCFTLTKYGKELYKALSLTPDYQMMNLIISRIESFTQDKLFKSSPK
jgi:hypothetical protein